MFVQIPGEMGGCERSFLAEGCSIGSNSRQRGRVIASSTALLWGSIPNPAVPERPSTGWMRTAAEGGKEKTPIFEKMHLQKVVVAWFVTSQH